MLQLWHITTTQQKITHKQRKCRTEKLKESMAHQSQEAALLALAEQQEQERLVSERKIKEDAKRKNIASPNTLLKNIVKEQHHDIEKEKEEQEKDKPHNLNVPRYKKESTVAPASPNTIMRQVREATGGGAPLKTF